MAAITLCPTEFARDFNQTTPCGSGSSYCCGAHGSWGRVMGALEGIGPPAPPAAVMRILNRFTREEIGHAIEVLIALLDIWDGDPEAEITDAEDDFAEHVPRPWHGPGCPIADAAEDDDPAGGNVTDEPHDPDAGV